MYVHCHKCHWSQDDFWSWKWSWKFWKFRPFGYNPLSLIFDDVRDNIKPRMIKMDIEWAQSIGKKSAQIFSWELMLREIGHHIGRLFNQRWWTYERFLKERNKARCPRCGSVDDLDMD